MIFTLSPVPSRNHRRHHRPAADPTTAYTMHVLRDLLLLRCKNDNRLKEEATWRAEASPYIYIVCMRIMQLERVRFAPMLPAVTTDIAAAAAAAGAVVAPSFTLQLDMGWLFRLPCPGPSTLLVYVKRSLYEFYKS